MLYGGWFKMLDNTILYFCITVAMVLLLIGGTQKDTNGDEADGHDETLCPMDYEQNGIITDDDMFDLVVKPLPRGCKLTAIFDCCHSGSILDLPFTYQPDGKNGVVMRNNTKEALKAGFSAFQAVQKRDYGKLFNRKCN